MQEFTIEAEKSKWDHPYRVQVSKNLHYYEIGPFVEDLLNRGINCAVEKRGESFSVWRIPEQKWDVDDAIMEWFDEWSRSQPPAVENIVARFEVLDKQGKAFCKKRDRDIYVEFQRLKNHDLPLTQILNDLSEKFFLSTQRIREILFSINQYSENDRS